MKALIPAAGLGTRFLPATKAQPKEMLLVVDRPAIQYVVEEGLASGADEVVIVNSREKKAIEDHFTPNPELVALLRERGKDAYADAVEYVGNLPVSYVYQEEALGLGHAVRCAAEKTGDEPFYVLLGDVLVPGNEMLPAMKAVSDAHGGASVIAVMPVPDDQVSRFGVIAGEAVAENVWKVDSLVEKPSLTSFLKFSQVMGATSSFSSMSMMPPSSIVMRTITLQYSFCVDPAAGVCAAEMSAGYLL